MELHILVKNNRISEYSDRDGNIFVEGRKGSEYEILLHNNTSFRMKAVVSVDGLNILTGDTVWEKGYVVDAFATLKIPGWRINKDQIAKFEFSNLKGSYNSGSPNVGVIGVMWFKEIVPITHISNPILPYAPSWSDTGGNTQLKWGATCSASGNTRSSIGTAWGDVETFKTEVLNTKFENCSCYRSVVFYDDAAGLQKRGIYVRAASKVPDPFPTYVNDFGCKPPK